MKPIFYFLIAFVFVSIAFSLVMQDAEYAVAGIVLAAVGGAVAGLLKAEP